MLYKNVSKLTHELPTAPESFVTENQNVCYLRFYNNYNIRHENQCLRLWSMVSESKRTNRVQEQIIPAGMQRHRGADLCTAKEKSWEQELVERHDQTTIIPVFKLNYLMVIILVIDIFLISVASRCSVPWYNRRWRRLPGLGAWQGYCLPNCCTISM